MIPLRFRLGAKILEIGGGNNPLRDKNGKRATFNADVISGPEVDKVIDFSNFPLPFDNNSFDAIYSRYCMEHIEWHKIDEFVSEIYRILTPGGKAVFFVPNTYEQCKKIVNEGINRGTIELLFGSQEFPDHAGCHKTGFSPEYAKELFTKAGFKYIKTSPHPNTITDMIIEAYKIDEVFERQYFDDGTIGYQGYRDFATHYGTARNILKHNPESVLDIGGARGYIARIIESEGNIKATCMDISKHCYMTRATDDFIIHDATKLPWPFKDKEYDIAFSISFFEHIPPEILDDVIKESMRVSKRGVHGIHMTDTPFEELAKDIDITHQVEQPKKWWENKFREINPEYKVTIEHPRILEYDKPERQPPITIMPQAPDNLMKMNLGSFQDMFYDGWVNVDIIDLSKFAKEQAYHFIQYDVTKGLPVRENNTVDIIMSNHLIEHITREEGKKLLQNCYNALKKGGIIRFSTPDTRLVTQKYLDGKIMEFKYINIGVEQAHDEAEAYYNLLLAGHKTIYDEESLSKIMKETGFIDIERVSPFESRSEIIKKQTISTHPSLSLILEAQKPSS